MTRARLAASYVAIMLVGLLLLAVGAVLAIDRTMHASLDERLATEARAVRTFLDVRGGRLRIDADDRAQLLTLLGGASNALVLNRSGRPVLSSTAGIPRRLWSLPRAAQRIFDVGAGDAQVRVLVAPVLAHRQTVGSIVVWRDADWIAETDRNAAIAFGLAALVIAGLALLAGNLVTRQALDDAFARQRRFGADASHELRAPLAVIRAEADLSLRKDRHREEYKAAMQTVVGEADRMESIIGELLSAARGERARLQRERTDVVVIVKAVAERLKPAIVAKHGAIALQVPAAADIIADPPALERAILAVTHNAVGYAPAGGLVELHVSSEGNCVEIQVRDDGPGFSRGALLHAFERFWRDEGGGRHGSGLGLTIAKSLVEGCGGSIRISNRTTGGARVSMRFRAAR